MVKMDNFTSQEHVREIWQKIDQLHLSYLEMEESPEKIKQRTKLEDCILEFLCIASHDQKFFFRETEEVLHRSASSKKDFSGYKAATGWNAIQLYAGNLLSQPWRKEYRTIKTYCGFYKHQIEANLVGAELMFEAMGYKHAGDGILVLDGPICPDRVTNVSKDSLVAYVECQILKSVWEEVSTYYNVTWLEVLDFRKTHYGSPEYAVKALKYQHHQRQYQEHSRSYSQGSNPFTDQPHLHQNHHKYSSVDHPSTKYISSAPGQVLPPASGAMLPLNRSFPPLVVASPSYAAAAACPAPCCTNGYQPYGPAYAGYMPYAQPMIKPPCTNGYYCTNGYMQPMVTNNYNLGVPTGQLIELEPHNGYDAVDSGEHSRVRRSKPENVIVNDIYRNKNNNEFKLNGSDKEAEYEENWDYVYRDLESRGYTKDLGDRGDILSPTNIDKHRRSKEPKKVKATNLDEAMNNLTVSDRPLKISEALEKIEKRPPEQLKQPERRHSQSSSYENLVSDIVKTAKVNTTSNYSKTKTLPREKEVKEPPKPIQSKTLDMKKIRDEKSKSKDQKFQKWECQACTFLNETMKDICEMCSKTRTSKDEQPMEVGGSECSKCTLVNPKSSKVCEACGASLKNSPTYI